MLALMAILSLYQSDNIQTHLSSFHGKKTTVYGKNELRCGDVGKAVPCDEKATTASGVRFNPKLPMVAISIPKRMRIRPQLIQLRTENGDCTFVWLVDKKHERYAHKTPWDITPKAAELLRAKSGDKLFICKEI